MAETDKLLSSHKYKDYCPNGLQVQGKSEIKTLISGVTASQSFIERAAEKGADALIVHHGCFWNNDEMPIVGMKHARIKALLAADVNLIAYHLPLDAHLDYGNNAQLAATLDLTVSGPLEPDNAANIGLVGRLSKPMPAGDFAKLVAERLDRVPVHIGDEKDTISTIGWCSGAAQDYLTHAVRAKVDAYLTGEISEKSTHEAREQNIHYFAAGHHATERGGVQALGNYLAEKFSLTHEFIDVPNPA